MIEAELSDGTILEFPDGTPVEVIQRTVKRMVAGEIERPRVIGEMSPEEIGRLDPSQHGGAERVPLLDDPVLGTMLGGAIAAPALGRAAVATAKPLLKYGPAGGLGAWFYDQLTRER